MVCKPLAIKCAGNIFSTLLIVCFGCIQTALAGGLTISPVLLELDALHKAVTVTLRNGGDIPLTFQSSALIWQQIDGIDQYTPTDAVLVAPAIIEIPAQSSQVFRVTLRQFAPGFMEQSYRLLLEDVSRPPSDNEKPAVALRLIHSLPLLVAPAGKTTVGLRWSPCPAQDKPDCVRLTNAGNRHVKVRTITISGQTESNSGAENWQQQLDTPATLLAGAWRDWKFDLPKTGASISEISVKNERDTFIVATRETFTEPNKSTALTVPAAISCLLIPSQDAPYAQAFVQNPGTDPAFRTADLQPCASNAGGNTR